MASWNVGRIELVSEDLGESRVEGLDEVDDGLPCWRNRLWLRGGVAGGNGLLIKGIWSLVFFGR